MHGGKTSVNAQIVRRALLGSKEFRTVRITMT
jgi:hypothetical protein